jgi:hypothetical protein
LIVDVRRELSMCSRKSLPIYQCPCSLSFPKLVLSRSTLFQWHGHQTPCPSLNLGPMPQQCSVQNVEVIRLGILLEHTSVGWNAKHTASLGTKKRILLRSLPVQSKSSHQSFQLCRSKMQFPLGVGCGQLQARNSDRLQSCQKR